MTESPRKPRQRPPLRLGGRSAGEPPRRQRLTTERVVDAAMTLMERGGYEAVTMRSLAQELGAGVASLYTHVANREELDQLVLDRVASKVPRPEPDPDRWAEQVKQLLRDTLGVYRSHPGSARAAMAVLPVGNGATRATEALLALCLAGGITPQAASWFCDLAALYVGAVAHEESIWILRENSTLAGEPADHEALDVQIATFFESLPVSEFPLISALARVITYGDGDQRFEFGLDILLSGLAAASQRYARDDDAALLARTRQQA